MKNNQQTTYSFGMVGKHLRVLVLLPLLCCAFAAPAFAEKAKGEWSSEAMMEKVSINSADAQSLAQSLEGIGESKAQAIIEWREANGAFTSIDQLSEVKGIGAATVAKNRDKLTL
jgi:competence protein ComEA